MTMGREREKERKKKERKRKKERKTKKGSEEDVKAVLSEERKSVNYEQSGDSLFFLLFLS